MAKVKNIEVDADLSDDEEWTDQSVRENQEEQNNEINDRQPYWFPLKYMAWPQCRDTVANILLRQHRGSTLDSLTSSMKEHTYENGRRYHGFGKGKYPFPNDTAETERLEIVFHMYTLLMGGRTHLAPIENNIKHALDIGCGAGTFAFQFAEEFPDTELIGIDITPIQPAWVPKNLTFQIEDVEAIWNFTHQIDYIRCYNMIGSVKDWEKLIGQCFKFLKPGGYLEVGEAWFDLKCDDGTMPPDSGLAKWSKAINGAANKVATFTPYAQWAPVLEKHGFENVKEHEYILPVNPWPKSETLKDVGRYHRANLEGGLEAITTALMTRIENWEMPEVNKLVEAAKKDLRRKKVHAYHPFNITYGQKPQ